MDAQNTGRSTPHHDGQLVVVGRPTVDALLPACVTHLRAHLPPDPFLPITIGVQSRGMARWLAHQLADTVHGPDGIAANFDFAFPGQIIDRLVVASGISAAADVWDARELTWHVADVLVEHADDPALASLRRDTADGIVRRPLWHLARGIADVFHDYALARVSMVQAWRDGNDLDGAGQPLDAWDAWQPALWRLLVARDGLRDPTAALDQAIDAFATRRESAMPELAHGLVLFGLNVLPPRHLALLKAVARHVPVTWFVPTVSHAYWQRSATTTAADVPAHHPLVASSGRMMRISAHLLADVVAANGGDILEDLSVAPDTTTVLGRLQRAIRDDLPVPNEPAQLSVDDDSVQVHGAHSVTRQAEIARDAILGVLDAHGDLQPRDVIVLVPDIDAYAPVITAACASDGKRPELPIVVADRHVGASDPVAEAVLAVLHVAAGRLTASDVLELLDREPIAARLGVSAHDLARLRAWVVATGIRWGIDAEDRQTHGQPRDDYHTWRSGLDRLLLGVAMAADDDAIVGGITPYDAMEGDDVAVLGRVAAALDRLFATVGNLRDARPLNAWARAIRDTIEATIQVDETARWRLDNVLDALDASAQQLSLSTDLAAFTASLEDQLATPRGAAGYESGAVTLCEFLPMRSIPHAVVCLVGLDDTAFPRLPRRRGFNLIERGPQLTDRDRRDEDRHLFLEAVLAARSHLIVTATTRSIRTNEPVNPSVLVTELLEALDRYEASETGEASSHLVTHHPLHAFSPRNFGADGPAFSFDAAAADAAVRLQAPPSAEPTAPLVLDVSDDESTCTLDDLATAVAHPVRYFFERRLDVHLRQWIDEIDNVEPLAVRRLDRPGLITDALQHLLDGDIATWHRTAGAGGQLPAGTPGVVSLEAVRTLAEEIAARIDNEGARLGVANLYRAGTTSPVEVPIGAVRLRGDIHGVVRDDEAILVHIDPRSDRPERRLRAWINHLAASAIYGRVATITIVLQGNGLQLHRLTPLADMPSSARENANECLAALLDIRSQAHTRILPLFAHASAIYVSKGRREAAGVFEPDPFGYGTGDRDAYVRQAFGDDCTLEDILRDPQTADTFDQLARTVWEPFNDHRVSRDSDLVQAIDRARQAASA